ncbi:MAG TPA: metallophosphoesterase, partial [Tepidisphaeraceae bacterium]
VHVHRTWMPAWTALHERLAADPPDLILVSGDFVDDKADHRPALPLLRRFAGGLRARLGVWGVLGNHDTDLLPLRVDADWPVRLLYNDIITLEHAGATLRLIGLHGIHNNDADDAVLASLPPRAPGVLTLALSHTPTQSMRLRGKADVVFTGHTHGGQVCLPGGWPIITHDALSRRFASGMHRFDPDFWLSVSRGCGFSSYAVRVFCPAEVVEIVFR